MAHYAIIDYAGETIEEGFPNARAAYVWLSFKFSDAFIHEMQMKVIKEESEEWVNCSECEEKDICPEANNNDGCFIGSKTPKEGG